MTRTGTRKNQAAPRTAVKIVREIPAAGRNAFYVSNRAPLQPGPLVKMPIGSIVPRGWLRRQLELEAQGMIGRLAEISPWLTFKGNAWASPDGLGDWGWEELPYWLKGYGDLGYVMQDQAVIRNACRWIDAVLASQEADGYFGPRVSKNNQNGHPDFWAHMVMLNVLQSFHEFSGDARVLPFMLRYHAWMNSLPPAAFEAGFWARIRFGDNIETIHWLYNRTGKAWLLDLAAKIHANMAAWHAGVIDRHNVNIAQGFRAAAVFYQQSGEPLHLESAERNYRTVMETYGQFPGGGFVGDENIRIGFVDPRGGFETCGWVEFMHSFEMLTKISGNPLWAERCEEIAFNSFPASMTADQKGLHYLSCPNQVQLDQADKRPGIENRGPMFSFSPFEVYRCCQHNVSHGWPYYAEELWLASADNGLCASLYAASEVTARVGDGTTVKIAEETDYPFGETVALRLSTPAKVRFPLYLRLPGWTSGATIAINGKNAGPLESPGPAYAVVDREWSDGDRIEITLPMALSVRRWERNKRAASVHHGPLAFSLKIAEKWASYGRSKGDWSEWEVFPASPWNYGLVLGGSSPARSLTVKRKPAPVPAQPFTPEDAPVEIRAKVRRIPQWKQDGAGMAGELPASPVRTAEPLETATLVPMGCARLRISSFPVIGAP